jgi:nucleoside phosphorylase
MRVALLAPMQQELRPLVTKLRLERSDAEAGHYVGTRGEVEVVARLTGIGMRAAARATASILDAFPIDHVMVVGIAGGVDPDQPIGASINPELVVDDPTGRVFRPAALSAAPQRGRLVTSDRLVTDPEEAERLRQQALAGPDGSGKVGAVLRYLLARPWRLVRLARLARGTLRASEAAAGAAIHGLDSLSP